MNAPPRVDAQGEGTKRLDEIRPLEGEAGIPDVEAPARQRVSMKGLLTLGLFVLLLIALIAFGLGRLRSGAPHDSERTAKLAANRPSAASIGARKLELSGPTVTNTPSATPRVPALVPTADELAEPIGVRRTAPPAGASTQPRAQSPQDAPAVLLASRPIKAAASDRPSMPGSQANDEAPPMDAPDPLAQTRRNLAAYQNHLQNLLGSLTPAAATATRNAGAPMAGSTAQSDSSGGLFGGTLRSSTTPRAVASTLGNRSLVLAKGTAFTCALTTRIVSATSGMVACQVQRNVYSDDGRVLLIERGSHLEGEYRMGAVRPGTIRIPVLWTRIRTPEGVTIDVESPGTGQLGESGVDGYVDNRWGERIGAAMLLSLIDDSVKLVIEDQSSRGSGETIVLPSTTSNTSKLAEKVLDSTINIPPTIYQNQGGIVGIHVARDVDFSSVYELRPTALAAPGPDTSASMPEARP